MQRPVQHRRRRPEFDDPPAVHDGYPVGESFDDREVVRNEQAGEPQLGLQRADQAENPGLRRGVQRAGRFIGQDQVRIQRDCAGDGGALLLPAGQFMRVPVTERGG
jgi:hypothetical protein